MPSDAASTKDLREILDAITFVPSCIDFSWKFELEELWEDVPPGAKRLKGWLVNTTFRRPDVHTGVVGEGRGRQLYIAVGTTETAVFFSAWVLVDLIVKHELMEAIRYKGMRVLDPHHTVEELSLPERVKRKELFLSRSPLPKH